MEKLHTLSSEIILSIHNFSVSKFSEITIQKEPLCPSSLMDYYNTMQPLYSEWLEHVRMNEERIWSSIQPFKNNLSFLLSVFEQFKKEVKLQMKKNSYSHGKEDYFHYANNLFMEAYGLPLEKKDYSKKELINIIKRCERDITTKPQQNKIIPLFP